MSIRTLVIDDEPLARERILRLLKTESDIDVIGECANGTEALEAIQSREPDLVFLDLQMPGMTGFEVLRSLDETQMPAVVFVTAYDKHAVEAFAFHALDYLLKPFTQKRFRQALQWVRKHLQARDDREIQTKIARLLESRPAETVEYLSRLAVKSGGRTLFVPVKDVHWIEAAGNYLVVHLDGHTHIIRETMAGLEAQLSPKSFVRVSRSAMVNVEGIKELQPMAAGEHVLILHDGTRIPVTRSIREIEGQLRFS